MLGINELLRPQDDHELELDRTDSLVLSAQIAIQEAMAVKGVSQGELADRLGVSPARVSQIVAGNGANLTLKTIGRIAHALDEQFDLVAHREAVRIARDKHAGRRNFGEFGLGEFELANPWKDNSANDNRYRYAESIEAAITGSTKRLQIKRAFNGLDFRGRRTRRNCRYFGHPAKETRACSIPSRACRSGMIMTGNEA